jgi:hypothetical protein
MTPSLLEMGDYIGLFGNRHFPVALGKFLSNMAKRAENNQGEKI